MSSQTSFFNQLRYCVAKIEGDSFTIVRVTSMPTAASPQVRQKFDYTSLDATTSRFVQQQTGEIRVLMKRTAQDIIEVGKKLNKIKERLGHGRFLNWLEAEFAWHRDTANKFMNVANQFGAVEMSEISAFDLSALYQLAAPSTPEAAREEAITRARAGEAITHKAARSIKQKYATPATKPKAELISQQPESTATLPIPVPLPQSSGSKLEIVAFRPQAQATAIPQAAGITANQTGTAITTPRTNQTTATPDVPGIWWQLSGRHLLYSGDPNSPQFLARVTKEVELVQLLLAFPSTPYWQPSINARARVVIEHYLFQDKSSVQLDEILEANVLFCSRLSELVVTCFLPTPEILAIINRLDRRCLIAEPDLRRVNALISDWKKAGLKAERVS